ncbi:MAG: hypothetical protein ACI9BD_000300 [Candidatus Marinamargulisbacteria bacterium]|jgi:hypothetical protein
MAAIAYNVNTVLYDQDVPSSMRAESDAILENIYEMLNEREIHSHKFESNADFQTARMGQSMTCTRDYVIDAD